MTAANAVAPCRSEFDGRMVFVLGTARSGTSWLSELLRAHPDIGGIEAESLVFNGLDDFWDNAHRSDGEGISQLLPLSELAAVVREYCDRVFAAARERTSVGTAWFVEKSPTHSMTIPIMAVTHPDAWYVHIVRDGRDVVRSLLAAPFGTDDPAQAASLWAGNVRNIRNHSWRLPRYREIRYEQMLQAPEETVASLFEWIGAPAGEEVMDAVRARSSTEVARFGSTDPLGAGKWRSMDPEVLATIDGVAHDVLAELGYLGPPLLSEAPPE